MCCVLGVGDEMFICGQGTGIYAATRDDTIWGYLVVRYCMAGRFMSVCSAVDVCVCAREDVRDSLIMCAHPRKTLHILT